MEGGNNSFIRFDYDGWVYDADEERQFEGVRFEFYQNGQRTEKELAWSQGREYLRLVRSGNLIPKKAGIFCLFGRHV